MEQNNINFQLPKICCRCGEKQGNKSRQINNSRVADIGELLIPFIVKKSFVSFYVPVCDECFDKLTRADNIIKTIRYLSVFLITGWFLYTFISLGYAILGIILSIAIYYLLHIAIIRRPISGNRLGIFSGNYFWFANKEFFMQFAELNPQLIAPYRFQPNITKTESAITEEKPRFSLPDRKTGALVIVFILVILGMCSLFGSIWISAQ